MDQYQHDDGDQRGADELGRPDSRFASAGRVGPGWAGESAASTDSSGREPEFDTKRGGAGGLGSREGYGNYGVDEETASSEDAHGPAADVDADPETDAPVPRVSRIRRTDAEIQRDVELCIRAIPTMDASRVNVEVVHGVVRLFGTVPTRRERWLVEDCGALARDILALRSEIRIERPG